MTGKSGGVLGAEWGELAGDPVSFEIDTHATDPLRPDGSFHVIHRKPDGRLLAEFSGRTTSLYAVDEVAVVTGVIERAEHPDVPLEFVGKKVAFTVYDGGRHDRIGWVWGFFGAPVNRVQGTAPTFPLSWGDFTVKGGPGQQPESPRAGSTPKGNRSNAPLITQPTGTPDGTAGTPDGTAGTPDRTAGSPDGTFSAPDGTFSAPDGTPGAPRVTIASGSDGGRQRGTSVRAVLGGTSKAPAFRGDPLRFSLAARIAPGGNAKEVTGGFHVMHHKPDGSVVADFEGKITCLTVGGKVGVATGVVTRSAAPELVGKPVSFSLKDGRMDRLGWLWGFSATDEPIVDCQSTVPFYAPDWGGLTVR
ncbi:hypothetical protein GCM10009789_04780 [Kribbella sancticallisti]|uniref:Uncharacterized protein n=1 Tax=Kribbella sancticallisti TaxID=460087 RepID=A0ABN2C867_9ACTN